MTSEALLNWLEAVSKGLAKQKQMPKPKVFMFDLPVRPRYKYWWSHTRYDSKTTSTKSL